MMHGEVMHGEVMRGEALRGGRARRLVARGALALCFGTCLALTGCYADPFANPNDWAMNSAPRENLAAQVADKSELLQGHGSSTSNGVVAAAGVDLALDQPKGDAIGLQTPPKAITFTSAQN